jgi:hypothetical protein
VQSHPLVPCGTENSSYKDRDAGSRRLGHHHACASKDCREVFMEMHSPFFPPYRTHHLFLSLRESLEIAAAQIALGPGNSGYTEQHRRSLSVPQFLNQTL